MSVGGWISSAGVNPPVSSTLSSGVSIGGTTVPITSATGLPTITPGSFGTARIQAEGANTAENICYTRSGTTLTLVAPGPTTLASAHASGATIDFDVISPQALDEFADDVFGSIVNALSGAGALTIGQRTINVCTFTSGPATVTLADGTIVGQVCRIRVDRTSTKLVTIDPAGSTTIDGSTTRIMWAGETAALQWNGTEWNKIAGKTIPMIAELYYTGSTIGATVDSTYTLVPLNTAGIDNTGLMVNTGASKIVINRPGNYTVADMAIWLCGSTVSNNSQAVVFKNGTGGTQAIGAVGSWSTTLVNLYQLAASKTVPAVVTDDFSLAYYQTSGTTTPTLIGGRPTLYLTVTEIPSW